MKASYSWLKYLVPGLPADPREVARRFTAAGLEVEAIAEYGAASPSCVLAWVVSIRPHPTKSGLRLVTVDRGGGTQEVICGAPNVPDPGGVVVLAPLGAHLPAKGLTIARREIGGVVSEGMLCSEAELGLSEDSTGIIVLPPAFAEPGTKLSDAIPETHDTLLEIGLTPNRPDGLGHLGLAREAAALFELAWTVPEPEAPVRAGGKPVADRVRVRIEDAERCPHYAAGIVDGVTIGPSPAGIQHRLSALGVRSISNAVDITNFILFEYGHPMHAFDADKIRGGEIIVRRAKDGEKLVTLDGVERTLVADDLVIADAVGPIALAGVMGGASTEISAETKSILLECAYFDPRSVRRTARRHGLHSESSHRFERGVDHGDTRAALQQATAMTCRLTRGTAAPDVVFAVGRVLPAVEVRLRGSRLSGLLGVHVPLAEASAILGRLGFAKQPPPFSRENGDADDLTFLVPTHRPDVARETDLIDEVVRVRGMDAIPTRLPPIHPTQPVGGREALTSRFRAAAVALGLSEAITYGFVSPRSLLALGAPAAAVTLKNPLSELQSVMRTSLLPGLLDALSRARRHGVEDVRLFSMGSLFLAGDAQGLPRENAAFALVLAGTRPGYLTKPQPVDVWDVKGVAEGLLSRALRAKVEIRAFASSDRPSHLHPRGAAAIYVQNTRVGLLGPLHPDVAEALEVGGECQVLELDLDLVATLPVAVTQYTALPRFPKSPRDIALVVKNDVPVGEVESVLRAAAGELATDVQLFDRFVGGSIPAGHASLAFRIVYRAADRTLTDAEVDARH
ncbi:MAG TPA: phenylalanine--tRNA ligase subunit beta, partial [Polyangiaceae bacterium]